jgi:hypothetical protein
MVLTEHMAHHLSGDTILELGSFTKTKPKNKKPKNIKGIFM